MAVESTEILGCRVDLVDMDRAIQVVEELIASGVPSQVVTLNAEMIYRAQKEEALKAVFAQAKLVTPDGIGTVWACRRQGHPVRQRVTGIDLAVKIMERAVTKGWKIFFLGGKPGVAERAAANCQKKYPGLKVVGTKHGYFGVEENRAVVDCIRRNAPDVLFVALGSPKQEYWIAHNLAQLMVPVCLGVGGTLDVLSGQVKRAPRFFIKLGLEWLYRLITEPTRFKRQLALPKFFLMVLLRHPKREYKGRPAK